MSPRRIPAKVTDSRFESYAAQHGNESWELDALEPRVLAQLITDAVNEVREDGPFELVRDEEERERALLGKCSERWNGVVDYLKSEE